MESRLTGALVMTASEPLLPVTLTDPPNYLGVAGQMVDRLPSQPSDSPAEE